VRSEKRPHNLRDRGRKQQMMGPDALAKLSIAWPTGLRGTGDLRSQSTRPMRTYSAKRSEFRPNDRRLWIQTTELSLDVRVLHAGSTLGLASGYLAISA